jgi:hypothetical protein
MSYTLTFGSRMSALSQPPAHKLRRLDKRCTVLRVRVRVSVWVWVRVKVRVRVRVRITSFEVLTRGALS